MCPVGIKLHSETSCRLAIVILFLFLAQPTDSYPWPLFSSFPVPSVYQGEGSWCSRTTTLEEDGDLTGRRWGICRNVHYIYLQVYVQSQARSISIMCIDCYMALYMVSLHCSELQNSLICFLLRAYMHCKLL